MMKIVVPIKLVPDLVEELSIDPSGTTLDRDWLCLKVNEFDDHAVEQSILLKEHYDSTVTLIAPDMEGSEDALFTAAARGADQLIKLCGDFETEWNNHALARMLLPVLKTLQPDLILTGVSAHNDLDGSLGPLLAAYLDLPYLGYVSGVRLGEGTAEVHKEYPGGLVAEMAVTLPAVLGVQAAEQPPRYVPFSKIRQAMKSALIEEQVVQAPDPGGGAAVVRMLQPELGEGATMLQGDIQQQADRLVEILQESGVV
jgi:electron transfer flavoprotein beta subunit